MPALKKQPKQASKELATNNQPLAEEIISIQDKFKLARSCLATALVERETEIDLALTAMIAQEHLLLVGPPGTAKSSLIDNLVHLLGNAQAFSVLFNKFTTPEEVFGPISVQGLKEDKYRRVTTHKLPEADLLFADEIFKAGTAILNTMLKILNERLYDNGDGTYRKCPLLLCLAASNEWPNDDNGGKELGALFDRFLFRKTVNTVSKTGRKGLLGKALANDPCQAIFPCTLSPAEIKQARNEATQLPYPLDTKKAFVEILDALNQEGVFPGDRRMFKAITAARASAYLQGAKEVLPEHLEVLAHVLWDDPTEQPLKTEKVVARIANPLGVRVFDLQQQAADVNEQTDKRLTEVHREEDRIGLCETAKKKLREIRTELNILKQDARRDKVVDYIDESLKDWDYKILRANRE